MPYASWSTRDTKARIAGPDTNTAASDHIQLHAGNNETLGASLNRIQHTSTRTITGILGNANTNARE